MSLRESPVGRRDHPDARTGRSRLIGLAAVILVHVLVAWGLFTGMLRKAVDTTRRPITVDIVDAVQPAPKPIPSPPPAAVPPRVPPPPRTAPPPPPPVVPVPRVEAPVATPPPVRSEPVVPPSPVVEGRDALSVQTPREVAPAPPVQAPAPSPPAPTPTPAPPAPKRLAIEATCPDYKEILGQALAGQWDRVGITGVVTVELTVRGDRVVDVRLVSGPQEYFRAIQRAAMRLRCTLTGANEAMVLLPVSFREPS